MDNGKPTIIIAKTIIGKGIPEVEGTNAAHGEAGVPFQKTARAHLGLPADELWHVAPEVRIATTLNLPHTCCKCRWSLY
jgi:transketolase